MLIGGSFLTLPALLLAWNYVALPVINSDSFPLVGAQRYAIDQKTQKTIAETLRDTVETLAKTTQNVEDLSKWQAFTYCQEHNRRVRLYTERLKDNPRDQSSAELRDQAVSAVRALPGCALERP